MSIRSSLTRVIKRVILVDPNDFNSYQRSLAMCDENIRDWATMKTMT